LRDEEGSKAFHGGKSGDLVSLVTANRAFDEFVVIFFGTLELFFHVLIEDAFEFSLDNCPLANFLRLIF
jgi:hypothetical protein